MKGLRIADGHTLPLDGVTQTLACIGRKGAGKTYLATLIAEQMLDAHAQIVALDPVGNWFGLRVSADGKSAGKEIFVIGGEHGDVALVPEAGARIARLIVEKNISAVLDLSPFRQGERKRFATDFAEELFHLKKTQRSAVHLFVEEAQLFAPQRPGPDEARMLGAFENIVRLGRNYGIGCTLVTQRPQSVNKEVLSQVECLCVLQVNGTHERKALEEWVQEAGADRKLVGQLPGLARGEGYIWSPSWLRIFERVHFAQKQTFDASATPEVGRSAKAASLSVVDVESIRADLAEVIAKAEQDDPAALRRRIAELEREARKPMDLAVDVAALEREFARGKIAGYAGAINALLPMKMRLQTLKTALEEQLGDLLQDLDRWEKHHHAKAVESASEDIARSAAIAVKRETPNLPHGGNGASSTSLPRAERRILTALAQHGRCTRAKIAIITGYAVSGGGFGNAMSALRSAGLITRDQDPEIMPAGVNALGGYDPLPSGDALFDHWYRQLPKAERKILEALRVYYPRTMSKSQLANAAGYEMDGGGFGNALSKLRTLELIKGSREIKAAEELF